MSYVIGADRNQPQLLPASIEDYVGQENPVRAIDAFVEGLDLVELGFCKSIPAETGRPPYNPADLLKLYIWGYLNRTHSSRRLETECQRNLELIWLLSNLRPVFKTIAEFRRANSEAIKRVFRSFSVLCRELGLFGRELVAIDGTKFKASNHPNRRRSEKELEELLKALDERIEEYMKAAEQSDVDLLGEACPAMKADNLQKKLAALQKRKGLYQELLKVAQARGEKVPLTDPDCQSMKKVGLGYNAQTAVDSLHHLLVVAEIAEKPTDHSQLPSVAATVREVLEVKKLKAVADAGYQDRCAIAAAHYAGIECYVPHPRSGSAVTEGNFHKADFVYESENDAYLCPAGKRLWRNGCFEKRGQIIYGYANPEACRVCTSKAKCIKGSYRRIERWEDESLMEVLDERTARHPEIIKKRKALVEHPFGTIKFWRNQGAFLTRGRKSVQAELSLSALAYNLSRVFAILGVKALVVALRARKGKCGVGSRFLRNLALLWPSLLRQPCLSGFALFPVEISLSA